MKLQPDRTIDKDDWRDPTMRSDLKQELHTMKPYNKWKDRAWGLLGIAVFFVIGMMIASGWL